MTRGQLGSSACTAVLFALLTALTACSQSRSPSVGGETNWLKRCSTDEPCEQGSCLCGVCTRACDGDERCAGDFEGECKGTADGAAAELCRSNASVAAAPAMCLPRCSSDDACGRGYQCEQRVCVPATRATGGPPDGGGQDGSVAIVDIPAPLLDELARSEQVWNALAAEAGDTYWYEEQNCVVNVVGGGGEATVVQVEDGVARVLEMHPVSACVAKVNRYGALQTNTMPELYALCANLLTSRGSAVTVTTDEQDVIASCFSADEPGCFDACGSGFALSGWGFGRP